MVKTAKLSIMTKTTDSHFEIWKDESYNSLHFL
jgi:hypothetical protein